jgi:hypothetical protein
MKSTAKTNTAKDLEKIFSKDFRQSNSMVTYLLRGAVERAEYLIQLKQKDEALHMTNCEALATENILQMVESGEGSHIIMAAGQYNCRVGAMHWDETALQRADDALIDCQTAIEMLEEFIEMTKKTHKDVTGDAFTYKNPNANKGKVIQADELRAKYRKAS